MREAGGLAIIGTERHESRRVDRQLRGRAGRQGDPGSSVFFISLEDHLMRLFASDRIASLMDRMGFEEGDALENKMLSNSVERAQKKVEENNFGIRKRLLEYDDVMNSQQMCIRDRCTTMGSLTLTNQASTQSLSRVRRTVTLSKRSRGTTSSTATMLMGKTSTSWS